MTNNTAVLIFANSNAQEGKNKSFSYGSDLFALLNRRIVSIVKKSGLPYFLYTEKEQTGNNFAERFTNAINDIYSRGYGNVITLGNDTPQLKTRHLTQTAELLQQEKTVLGPSADGGFYLMGIAKSSFEKLNFIGLPWQTSRLSKSLETQVQSKGGQIQKLQVLNDLDSVSDLKKLIHIFEEISTKIRQVLLSLVGIPNLVAAYIHLSKSNLQYKIHLNKGSPVK